MNKNFQNYINKKGAFLNAAANHILFYPTPANFTYA